jgi:hypothetical protein
MTGSLRLSALLLLLLSRWASADLEKGEDEFVRSWVIIEEQLVPPSRDELLAAGGGGTTGGGGAGRRITPKSVFVAPAFNKCSDGYRADSMGRCVKVVKLNQAAQWDFLLKQLNSQYSASGMGVGFPMMPAAAAVSAYQPTPLSTTTTEPPPQQKTDSPGPFQLNIPLSGGGVDLNNHTMETVDELTTSTSMVGTTVAGTTATTTNTAIATITATDATVTAITGDDGDVAGTIAEDTDDQTITTDVLMETTVTVQPRPYRNRYQTPPPPLVQDVSGTVTPSYDSTTTGTDTKTK